MSLEALIRDPGAGETLSLRGTKIRILSTAAQSVGASTFEFHAVPGFDTGSHLHSTVQEQFYVVAPLLLLLTVRFADYAPTAPFYEDVMWLAGTGVS